MAYSSYESAGVYDRVEDLSQYQVATSETRIGIIGVADRGEIGVPVTLSGQKMFEDIFGKPSKDGFGGLAAYKSLAYTNSVTFVRIANDFARYSSGQLVNQATKAEIKGRNKARYTFGYGSDNKRLYIYVDDRSPVSLTFNDYTYSTEEVVVILQALLGNSVIVSETIDGNIKIDSVSTGYNSMIRFEGDAAAILGFTGASKEDRGTDATFAEFTFSNTEGNWSATPFSSADFLTVEFDGDVNKTVNFTGSFIDGVDNIMDMIERFNTIAYQLNPALSSTASLADNLNLKLTSPISGLNSAVKIVDASTRVKTVFGMGSLTLPHTVNGVNATGATITNILKHGFDISIDSDSYRRLVFEVDGNVKDITLNDSGVAAFKDITYDYTSPISGRVDFKVADWTISINPDVTSGTTSINVNTKNYSIGVSGVALALTQIDHVVSGVNYINTTYSGVLGVSASNTDSGTSGVLSFTAINKGSQGNNIDAYVSYNSGILSFVQNPSDNTLGYGTGSILSNLDRVEISDIVREVNRQAGGVYMKEEEGYPVLVSSSTGAGSYVNVLSDNIALGYVSGDSSVGKNQKVMATILANTKGKWGDSITVTTLENNSIRVSYENTTETFVGNTISVSDDFIEDAVNSTSNLITFEYTGDIGEEIDAGQVVKLSGGDSGSFVTNDDIIEAIDLFKDSEIVDINLFAIPGESSGPVIAALSELSTQRKKNVMIIADPPVAYSETAVVAWHNGELEGSVKLDDSSISTFYPWLRTNDRSNGIIRLVPPSVLVLPLIARNDSVKKQWTAPAGTTDGRLDDAIDVERVVNQTARDLLQSKTKRNAVNPIVKMMGKGIVIWGQKTTQRAQTSLDSINVSRLLIYLRNKIRLIALDIAFSPNDPTTWSLFTSRVNKFLAGVEADRGIKGFKVKMDNENNPPETIAQGVLFGSIIIKPTIIASEIDLSYTVVGQDFEFF